MARVGEIVRGRYIKTSSLKAEDLISHPDKLEIYIQTQKSNKTPKKIILFRNREAWLIDIIEAWAERVSTGELFPYSTVSAMKIFKRYFPEFTSSRAEKGGSKHTIHWLRGWRYTHYRRGEVTGRKVEARVVAMIGGWATLATPERYYDFTKIEDFEEELRNE